MSTAGEPLLVDLSTDPQPFFALLPPDWRAELVSLWPTVADSSTLWGLQLDAGLIGGGILFRKPTPDTLSYIDLAQALFDQGLLYIGYLWIAPAHRGHDHGGFWLQAVRRNHPDQGFWLAIEDRGLQPFYQRHGFAVIDTIHIDERTEWIMSDRDHRWQRPA